MSCEASPAASLKPGTGKLRRDNETDFALLASAMNASG
jgi:hypothetical protein